MELAHRLARGFVVGRQRSLERVLAFALVLALAAGPALARDAQPKGPPVPPELAEVLASGQPETTIAPSSHRPDRTIRFTMKPWPRGVALFADDITEREKSRDRKIADDGQTAQGAWYSPGVGIMPNIVDGKVKLTPVMFWEKYGGDFVNQPRSQWGPGDLVERPFDMDDVRRQFADANRAAGLVDE